MDREREREKERERKRERETADTKDRQTTDNDRQQKSNIDNLKSMERQQKDDKKFKKTIGPVKINCAGLKGMAGHFRRIPQCPLSWSF